MKICLAYLDCLGGWRTYVHCLSAGFARDGHQVSVLAFNTAGQLDLLRTEGVNVIPMLNKLWSKNRFLSKVVDMIQSIQPDVLLSSSVAYVQAAFPYLSGTIMRFPVVHSVNFWEKKQGLMNQGWWHGIITTSPTTRDELLCMAPKAVVHTIRTGIVDNSYVPVRDSMRKRPLRICYMGRISNYDKNILTIVRIALYLRKLNVDFEWSIAGDGSDRALLEKHVRDAGLNASFKFMGSLDREAALQFLRQQHILVLASIYEAFPLVLNEAMALGVVPVVSDIPGALRDVITHGEDGYLFNVTDPSSCAAYLKILDQDRDLLERLSKKAQENVQRHYSLRQTLDRYYVLFDQVSSDGILLKNQLSSKPVVPDELQEYCAGAESGFWSIRDKGMYYLRRLWTHLAVKQ